MQSSMMYLHVKKIGEESVDPVKDLTMVYIPMVCIPYEIFRQIFLTETFGSKFHILERQNKNQSNLKTFYLIKFSKVGFTTFVCESKTHFCYY